MKPIMLSDGEQGLKEWLLYVSSLSLLYAPHEKLKYPHYCPEWWSMIRGFSHDLNTGQD